MVNGIYNSNDILDKYKKKWVEECCMKDIFGNSNFELDEIGGENLISNSKLFEVFSGQSNLTNESYHGFNIRHLDNIDGNNSCEFTSWELPKVGDFNHNDLFTLSFWAKGTEIQVFLHGSENFITNKVLQSNGIAVRKSRYSDGCTLFKLTDNWERYYVTWQLNCKGDLNISKTLLIRVEGGNEAKICGVKFEKGDLFSNYSNKFEQSFNNFLIDNSYQIIKDSNLFDEKFYNDNYPDVAKLGCDPINHYLNQGVHEHCIPNSAFKEEEYLSKNKSLNGLNPFVHYILYGGGQIPCNIIKKLNRYPISLENFHKILQVFEKGVTIIIPIFNAYEDTKKCIESVLEHTTVKFNLILIDDKSTDLRISKLLDEYEIFPNIKIIRNEVNKGFTKNVNIGLNQTDDDVILLNSDTLVTPRWIQKIIIAAYSEEDIGTLTPISNASDISVPIINKNNPIPSFLNVNTMSYLVEKVSINGNLVAPTGNGFCLFIKRDTINDVGLFDEKNFGKGYGEESDFTSRAKNNGWKNIRNDSIFIYHKRSASFSLNKANNLKKKHGEILAKKHPNIFDEWRLFVNSEELDNSIQSVKYHIDNFEESLAKENILYITSISNNKPVIDNLNEVSSKYNIFLLSVDLFKLKLWTYSNNEFIPIKEIKFNSTFPNLNSLNCFYLKLLNALNIEFIFLQFNNTFKFLKYAPFISPIVLASKIGIPVLYGDNSIELINPITKIKKNRDRLLNNIIDENDSGVVYTAIFGNYEDLLEPKFINEDLDYICFTDNPNLKSNVWDIRLIDEPDLDNVRKARKVKILPHKYVGEYDYSLWVDAGFQIIGDLKQFINNYSTGKSFMSCIHTDRDCIYDEAKECLNRKKDDEHRFNAQIDFYKKNNFPEKFGLIESGVIFRKHNLPNVIKTMEDWCSNVINFTNRDQISLPYVLWKNNLMVDKYRLFYWKNPYFEHFYHQNFDSKDISLTNFRVLIIESEENKFLTEKSVGNIKKFNENIPITIIKRDDLKEINEFIMNIDEDFLVFLQSGDLIRQELIDYISKDHTYNLNNVGAIVFDYISYYNVNNSNIIKSNDFSLYSDFISNNVLINRHAIISIGGFDSGNIVNFIRENIIKLNENNFNIQKENNLGFKLTNVKIIE